MDQDERTLHEQSLVYRAMAVGIAVGIPVFCLFNPILAIVCFGSTVPVAYFVLRSRLTAKLR